MAAIATLSLPIFPAAAPADFPVPLTDELTFLMVADTLSVAFAMKSICILPPRAMAYLLSACSVRSSCAARSIAHASQAHAAKRSGHPSIGDSCADLSSINADWKTTERRDSAIGHLSHSVFR